MRRLLAVLAVITLVAVLALGLAWWWYLRADPMEPPALPGSEQTGVLEHGGHQRSWLAYVPAAKPPSPALVLVMHGSRGDGEQMREATRYGFDVLAERHGFIAVYPDGYERHWNDCRGGADYAANLENIDDVGFLRALVQRMVEEQGVDPARVFATGLSNGGQMAYRLGLEAPDLVAGIASMAASLPDPIACEPVGEAVATLVMNGTEDPVNPYEGGLVEIFGNTSRGSVLSSAATAGYWAGLAGYEGEGERNSWPRLDPDDTTSVESTDWSGPGRVPVSLVSIHGGGHTVPNPVFSLPRILGPTSHQLDGPEVIWAFFSSAAPGPR
ncbi:MAG: PHB depolymerase family esterase [Halieaceae bacterium]|jgi:polyhydroxybutyrate depolymerase|nr:PHB depolymerase family esterase [Halieaceae bacterium]